MCVCVCVMAHTHTHFTLSFSAGFTLSFSALFPVVGSVNTNKHTRRRTYIDTRTHAHTDRHTHITSKQNHTLCRSRSLTHAHIQHSWQCEWREGGGVVFEGSTEGRAHPEGWRFSRGQHLQQHPSLHLSIAPCCCLPCPPDIIPAQTCCSRRVSVFVCVCV